MTWQNGIKLDAILKFNLMQKVSMWIYPHYSTKAQNLSYKLTTILIIRTCLTYTPIGEIHGELVAQNLEICAPYPGDIPSSRVSSFRRFGVVRIGEDQYRVHDRVLQTNSYLSVDLIMQPRFTPGEWYANQCSIRTGVPTHQWDISHVPLTMGNLLESEITRVLRRGAPYAFDDLFPAVPLHRRFSVSLSSMMVENPAFDLVNP